MSYPLPPPVSRLERALRVPEDSLDGTDLAAATDALDDAMALALDEIPATVAEHWREHGGPASVRVVIVKAARREYENPRGISQEGQGDHSVTVRSTSGVYLTDREIATVRRAGRGSRAYVGSVRTPSAYTD